MKTKEAAAIPQKKDEESRREFLIKAGKMALYIPPAMMVLMHPSRNASAWTKSPCPPKLPRFKKTKKIKVKKFKKPNGRYS